MSWFTDLFTGQSAGKQVDYFNKQKADLIEKKRLQDEANRKKANESVYLTQLADAYTKQANNGLGDLKTKMASTMHGDIDRRFNEASEVNRENMASAGLTASGLGSVASAKLAGEQANAINKADVNIEQMDYQAKQQGLQGLFGVESGAFRREDAYRRFAEQKRQFNEQLKFQKDEAEYGWGDFFGDVLGFGGKVASAYVTKHI